MDAAKGTAQAGHCVQQVDSVKCRGRMRKVASYRSRTSSSKDVNIATAAALLSSQLLQAWWLELSWLCCRLQLPQMLSAAYLLICPNTAVLLLTQSSCPHNGCTAAVGPTAHRQGQSRVNRQCSSHSAQIQQYTALL